MKKSLSLIVSVLFAALCLGFSFSAYADDAKVLKDFVNSVIERIVLLDGRVASIEFKNGLVHEFLYRE